ncbi:G-protein coupled receptor 4-like [Ornithorhynchus anatinus]|uniref:G-protein coupled receptor 4-like n=1 Tax=Ornithorhynchus anatinus TaxID=9258 RepID=UPI0019D4E981|nr:G-protein coupled receptor 4-like [Ornithorhynchus anatinus]
MASPQNSSCAVDFPSNRSCPIDFEAFKSFQVIFLSLVLALGLPLNSLALRALRSSRRQSQRAWGQTALTVYLTNMAVANLLQLLTLPFWIHYIFVSHQWKFGFSSCLLVAVFFVTNFYAKLGFLCLVGLERCVGVRWPLLWRTWHSPRLAARVSLAWWVFVATLSTLDRYYLHFDPAYNDSFCSEAFPPGRRYVLFKISTVPLTFFGPLLFVSVSYGIILTELRKVSFLATRRQIFACIFLTVITFFLVLGPNQGVSIYRFLWLQSMNNKGGENCLCTVEAKLATLQNVTWCFTVLGNILDPLVYILPMYFQQGEKDGGQDFSHPTQESTLLKVTNDLLTAKCNSLYSILILLDLSTAPDAVDHPLLLEI